MPTALVTGSNRGIGLAFVQSLAADGWRVHACCRNPDKARTLKQVEGDVHRHRLDVTDGLKVASFARELREDEEAIDLLINNAGTDGGWGTFGRTDYDDWLDALRINTLAPMRMAERFYDLVGSSEKKLIVNISSKMGSIGTISSGGSHVYRSTKAALNMITRCLSMELAARGIVVVSLHPGHVQTEMGGNGAPVSAEDSVAGMREVIDGLTPEHSGRFFDYQGEELPW
jgi:NAD(P)-dependent dehydrogenase (short-subunit alcohol dehydrogenase family)